MSNAPGVAGGGTAMGQDRQASAKLDRAPDRYAVVGNPVQHSLSPQIHQAFAVQTGQQLDYSRLLVPVDRFVTDVAAFFAAGGAGLNVTIPFKTQAFAWVDQLDAAATVAGAVNTIVRQANGFQGCNTDGIGLTTDLTQNLKVPLVASRVLLLGAGGAAQGVVAPLLAAGVEQLVIANRTSIKAQQLVAKFAATTQLQGATLTAAPLAKPGSGFDVVINATAASIGGTGNIVPSAALAGANCYDMMYGPNTPFCVNAQQAGALACYDGLGMLVEQAAAAFSLWRGCTPATAPVLQQLREQGLGRPLS